MGDGQSIGPLVLDKYPGVYTQDDLNAFENMRGIPAKFNDDLHLSGFRTFWNEAYEFLDSVIQQEHLSPGTAAYNERVRALIESYVLRLDEEFGHLYVEYGKVLR